MPLWVRLQQNLHGHVHNIFFCGFTVSLKTLLRSSINHTVYTVYATIQAAVNVSCNERLQM